MVTAEARIRTERPSRYLNQLCRHAATMAEDSSGHRVRMHAGGGPAHRDVRVHVEWSETDGSIRFDPWGQCTIAASAGSLILHAEAADEESLRQIQDVLTRDLGRFGRRDRLTVTWHRTESAGGEPAFLTWLA